MGKSEDKRAAIVAQQAARELAERELQRASGQLPRVGKRRPNWAASSPGRGRPPKPAGER